PFLVFLADFYRSHRGFAFADADFIAGKRMELPTYDFEKTRCWIREEPKETEEQLTQEVKGLKESGTPVENVIAEAIVKILEINTVSLSDDFFALGGDSLKATKLINEIRRILLVRLDFEDVFDFPTVSSLAEYVESQLTEELIVSAVYREVLRYEEEIDKKDDFFSMGGHSILATQVINRLTEQYSIDLNFDELFFNASVGSLAALIREKTSGQQAAQKSRKIPKAPQSDHYPVSYAQRRMIYANQMFKAGISYNATDIIKVEGQVDVEAFEKAFNLLIERHSVLRTSFHFIDGVPVQKVSDTANLKILVKDLQDEFHDESTQEVVVKQHINDFVDSFDLTKAPLFRVALFAIGHEQWVMVFDMDHSITDNASHTILTTEFLRLLKGETLTPLEIEYKDFTVWQENFFKSV
ncbi:MAG: condensation domain-containing protein, partial [Bacteroidota bacterium]